MLTDEGIAKWDGTTKWYESSIRKMLSNEKYKGYALLQKTYTVDFLTKKRVDNNGEVPKYYIEDSHPAIIDKDTWEAVQLEMERRRTFCKEHNIQKLEYSTNKNPFAGRVVCGDCGGIFGRKVWQSNDVRFKKYIWQCSKKYANKGEIGCFNTHVEDRVLNEAFVEVFNALITNKEHFLQKWKGKLTSENILERVTAKRFITIFEKANLLTHFDVDIYFKLFEKFVVIGKSLIRVCLLDGTQMEGEIE